jgi:hypothetical protein
MQRPTIISTNFLFVEIKILYIIPIVVWVGYACKNRVTDSELNLFNIKSRPEHKFRIHIPRVPTGDLWHMHIPCYNG